MHRLFVAIDPPEAAKDALLAAMGGVSGARWQRRDQLHLTLRFIGEVDTRTANDIADALAGIRHPAIAVSAGRRGFFDRRGRIDALWVGAEPQDALKALHNKVDRALARIGIAPDTRTYLPHFTLARLAHGAGSVDAFLNGGGAAAFPPFLADSVTLFESRLTDAGADYSAVARFALVS